MPAWLGWRPVPNTTRSPARNSPPSIRYPQLLSCATVRGGGVPPERYGVPTRPSAWMAMSCACSAVRGGVVRIGADEEEDVEGGREVPQPPRASRAAVQAAKARL